MALSVVAAKDATACECQRPRNETAVAAGKGRFRVKRGAFGPPLFLPAAAGRDRHKTMSDIVIRPLCRQDRADWARLWTGYLEFYKTSVPEAVYDSTFARLLGDDPQDFNGLLALVQGRPAGLVHFLFHRHCWKIENVCYLQDLYADPAFRGQGVGRALIEAVYAAADANGTPAVYWLTQDFNDTARVLYDRIAQVTPFIRYNRKP